jgi:uncharacterized cupin superfamily protein
MAEKKPGPKPVAGMDDPLPEPRPNMPIRAADEALRGWTKGRRFEGREVLLSRLGGATQVHVNLAVLPAGKQNGPYHYHLREEEHFYVLSGRCVLRSGEERYEVGAGDYVCFPAGTGVAHCFENPFADDCTMLTIGPSDPHEIAVYPDSGKAKIRALDAVVPWPQDGLDYWDGEDVGTPLGRPGEGSGRPPR